MKFYIKLFLNFSYNLQKNIKQFQNFVLFPKKLFNFEENLKVFQKICKKIKFMISVKFLKKFYKLTINLKEIFNKFVRFSRFG